MEEVDGLLKFEYTVKQQGEQTQSPGMTKSQFLDLVSQDALLKDQLERSCGSSLEAYVIGLNADAIDMDSLLKSMSLRDGYTELKDYSAMSIQRIARGKIVRRRHDMVKGVFKKTRTVERIKRLSTYSKNNVPKKSTSIF